MAAALIPVPQKPTHIQLSKKGASVPNSTSDIDEIRTAIMQDSPRRERRGGQGEGSSREERGGECTGRRVEDEERPAFVEEMWASCLYDDVFNSMKAPEPDDGLPRHRTAHVHRFDKGLGPNQVMYMPTSKSAKLMESLAPAVKYVYNHEIISLLEADGKHRIVAQKMDAAHESGSWESEQEDSEANMWQRGATGGTSRGTTGETDRSGRVSSRQGILKRQTSPPHRMSTATGKGRTSVLCRVFGLSGFNAC